MMNPRQADHLSSAYVPIYVPMFTRKQTPVEARFIARPNRFVAVVRLSEDVEQAYGINRAGDEITAHIADPGRLVELLVPGAKVYLVPAFPKRSASAVSVPTRASAGRKTLYDLTLVAHDGVLVSVDSRVPNDLVHLALQAGFFPELSAYSKIERESSFGNSRLDFRLSVGDDNEEAEATTMTNGGDDCLIEVKSATLVKDGVAMFPDAPTARGARHMRELAQAMSEGYKAIVLFVIQRNDASAFAPNRDMDPRFAEALDDALEAGVDVWAWRCTVTLEGISLDARIPVHA